MISCAGNWVHNPEAASNKINASCYQTYPDGRTITVHIGPVMSQSLGVFYILIRYWDGEVTDTTTHQSQRLAWKEVIAATLPEFCRTYLKVLDDPFSYLTEGVL